MPDFDNNGASVHYELVGSGPPLLMIAGTASDGASWGPLTPLLADRFRLILIDNRGSGRTRCEGPITIPEIVGDCLALVDRLGIGQVGVVGHSLGGFLGLQLAAEHPTKVTRLVTMASGVLTPKERALLRDMARVNFTMPPDDWFRLFYQWLFSAPFFADEASVTAAAEASTAYPYRQSPGDFARQVAAIERTEPTDLSHVRCPVLALAGELDLLSPPNSVAALHRPIKDLIYAEIARAARSLHWEAPEAVAKEIVGFLR
jgi:pimeloyl-ACP methyl ester carboxylesterase